MDSPSWNPAVDPGQLERDRRFGRWSQRVVMVVLVLSVGAIASPGSLGPVLGVAVVAAVILMPFVRVVWLLAIWVHQRDRRFVWFGTALLTMIVAGIAAAALRGR